LFYYPYPLSLLYPFATRKLSLCSLFLLGETEVIIAYLFWVVGTTERKPASSKVVGTTFQVPLIP
jgi:hypothetical protein